MDPSPASTFTGTRSATSPTATPTLLKPPSPPPSTRHSASQSNPKKCFGRRTRDGSSASSNLVRAEVPLRGRGRGNKLASSIVNPRGGGAAGVDSSSSALDAPSKPREIKAEVIEKEEHQGTVVMEESEESRVAKHDEEGSSEQQIWSWGAGTDGQLGTGRLQDEHLPQLLRLPYLSPAAGSICSLACGGAHVLALTSGGKVLTWGRGTSGQLGHPDTVNSPNPKFVMSLNNLFITHASAGWNHSGFVSDAGDLFTCGDGSFGQLGHGDFQSHCYPVKVSFFVDKHVEQIACGMRHSLVLVKGDEVYAFGSGKRGQLGISEDKIKLVNIPERIHGFDSVKITSIAANGDHSAALSADGHLYTWGRGFGGISCAHSPQRLSTSFLFTKVAVGWNHSLVLTGGEVFMLGGNHHGVLSNPEKITPIKHLAATDRREVVLEKVPDLEGTGIVHIASGAEHSAIVTEDGVIKTWGWGEHGQLGLGNTDDQTSPQEVSFGHKFRKEADTIEIYCGSGFTIVVRTSRRCSQTD
ncbi:hypothetical protein FF2_020885 [Malus domestica]